MKRSLPCIILIAISFSCGSRHGDDASSGSIIGSAVNDPDTTLKYILHNKWRFFSHTDAPIAAMDDSTIQAMQNSLFLIEIKRLIVLNDSCITPYYSSVKMSTIEFEEKELRKVTPEELGINSKYLYIITASCSPGNSIKMIFHDGILTVPKDGVYFHAKPK